MDLVLHGLTGVFIVAGILQLFGALVFTPTIIIILSIVWIMGAYPDLAGYIDGYIRGDKYRWNGWYRKSHDANEGIWKILSYIPFVWLHINIDKPWHDKSTGHWKWWGTYADLFIWAIIILVILTVIV